MTISFTKSRISHVTKDIAKLKSKEVSELTKKNRAIEKSNRANAAVLKANSTTQLSSRIRQSEQAAKEVEAISKRMSRISDDIAKKQIELTRLHRELESKEKAEAQKLEREQRSKQQRLRSQERASNFRKRLERRAEISHEKELAKIKSSSGKNKLKVLYLITNTQIDLRTDIEARQVLDAIKKSKFRAQVEIILKPAATFQDLLDGINEHRPQVIHFSGHAGGGHIGLEDGTLGHEPDTSRSLDYRTLAKVISASDHNVELVVLNACNTIEASQHLIGTVPVTILMSDSISDTAAIIFAQQFYSALSNGQSVQSSFDQASLTVEHTSLDAEQSKLPTLVPSENVDTARLILVALE